MQQYPVHNYHSDAYRKCRSSPAWNEKKKRYREREREREWKWTSCLIFLLQEYHLQNALDAQQRLGSAKIRAVPIPDLYEDPHSQSIYPASVDLPKQLIRLQRISFSKRALSIVWRDFSL